MTQGQATPKIVEPGTIEPDTAESETAARETALAETRVMRFDLNGHQVALQVDEAGAGATVVLLPALSTISTRGEMRPMLERLAPRFRVIAVDWPGFGSLPRPRVNWTPDILSDFLAYLMREEAPQAAAIVAAGHAASYALRYAVDHPASVQRLVLVAPTWRGPFPTMMKGSRPWFAKVRAAVDAPILGPILFRLNISRPVLMRMAKAHVYSDPDWLAGGRLAEKRAVTRGGGARHASVRFVTGALDRLESRDAFVALAREAAVPILVVYGNESPAKSRAEMEALGALPNVRLAKLRRGRLAVHEEYPDDVAAVVGPFLAEPSGL